MPVFCQLFEEIMMVNPQARKQFTLEKTVMDYLRNFVRDNKDVNYVCRDSDSDHKGVQTAGIDP